MPVNLLDLFSAAVDAHGGKVALVEATGREVTFNELAKRAEACAAHWASQGLKKGDQVLVAMPVSANLYASLAACWSLGVTAILPEPSMGLAGLRHAISATECKGLVAYGGYQWIKVLLPQLWLKPLFKPVLSSRDSAPKVTTSVDQVALISFTSGSTGSPKSIARSHAFLAAQYKAIAPLLASDREEIDLVAFPVFVLINLAAGRTSVLPNWNVKKLEALAPESLEQWITAQGITRALLPPSVCEKLAQTSALPQLTTVFTGGGPVFLDLAERLQKIHKPLRVVAVYGSTEAEPISHIDYSNVTKADKLAMRNGGGLLAGHPMPEVQLRIVDDEILVAGEHVNQGYLDSSQDIETKLRDGKTVYHRTGDAGKLDESGRIWLLGRYGKAIDGLYPFAVESAVRLWPGVAKAALANVRGKALLAVEGDAAYMPDWQRDAALQFNIQNVVQVESMPMDRRHRSKIDYTKLAKSISR